MATHAESKSFNKRPFAPAILKRAVELVSLYQVIVRWDKTDDCFTGRCVELPTAVGFGDTEAECLAEVRGNIRALVAFMFERGETPPLAGEPQRTNQINVRFADYEKSAAEALAAASGLTLSEHVRRAALRGT